MGYGFRNALILGVLIALQGCASWRVTSFIVDYEGTVLSASDGRGVQFLSDLAATDSGARAIFSTQGKPDYIFVEQQSVFGSDIVKLVYIEDDRVRVFTVNNPRPSRWLERTGLNWPVLASAGRSAMALGTQCGAILTTEAERAC